VSELPDREREVVKLRYGINGSAEPATMAEVGRRLGISPTAVKKLEERGLARLAERRELEALTDAA
jgi:DNA-directed RNA polymerase sigma subunit (sigma70/sigma32)